MPRTTQPAVVDILGQHYDTIRQPSLQAFILTASNLVSKIEAADSDNELDAETLELIERWLAAHFYAHSDQMLTSKSTEGASGSFQGRTDMFFSSTFYGQNAMLLDSTNYLANREGEAKSGDRPRPKLYWAGTETD